MTDWLVPTLVGIVLCLTGLTVYSKSRARTGRLQTPQTTETAARRRHQETNHASPPRLGFSLFIGAMAIFWVLFYASMTYESPVIGRIQQSLDSLSTDIAWLDNATSWNRLRFEGPVESFFEDDLSRLTQGIRIATEGKLWSNNGQAMTKSDLEEVKWLSLRLTLNWSLFRSKIHHTIPKATRLVICAVATDLTVVQATKFGSGVVDGFWNALGNPTTVVVDEKLHAYRALISRAKERFSDFKETVLVPVQKNGDDHFKEVGQLSAYGARYGDSIISYFTPGDWHRYSLGRDMQNVIQSAQEISKTLENNVIPIHETVDHATETLGKLHEALSQAVEPSDKQLAVKLVSVWVKQVAKLHEQNMCTLTLRGSRKRFLSNRGPLSRVS